MTLVQKSKTILMVAFEFPPSNGASVPRIESFYRYLKQWGWNVVVLTANPNAYNNVNHKHLDAEDDIVYRTFALDVPRHLSIKGKYWAGLAKPDRWGFTWIPSALHAGKKIIKRYQPDIIWSSSPIPSTHFIAHKLALKNNIPWVADYRDPFHYMNGSAGKSLDKIHQKIDFNTLSNANHVTFATSAVRDLYVSKYQSLIADKNTVIENGFDEANFQRLDALTHPVAPFAEGKFSMYYSGVLYANGRDPVPVFEAIAALQQDGVINSSNFELVFQGSGDGNDFAATLTQLGIQHLVRFIDPVPFINALYNMTQASALLLIQDKRFNKQIPGKVYEYLRTMKPLLVKADPEGETYKLAVQFAGVEAGSSAAELKSSMTNLLKAGINNHLGIIKRDLSSYSRKQKAQQLDLILASLL